MTRWLKTLVAYFIKNLSQVHLNMHWIVLEVTNCIPVHYGAYLSAVCAIFLWIFHWGVYRPSAIVSRPLNDSAEEDSGVLSAILFELNLNHKYDFYFLKPKPHDFNFLLSFSLLFSVSLLSTAPLHGLLSRYVKLLVAHAPGTFTPPPISKETAS